MGKKQKSFEKFYFTLDNSEHFTHEVQMEYDKKKGDISYFDGNMRCPECYQAELSFTHKTARARAYLSKIPSSSHTEVCSYKYQYAGKRTIINYIKSLSPKQRKDRLEAILNMLMKKKRVSKHSTEIEIKTPEQNPLLIRERNKTNNLLEAIRRKSLNTWMDESDAGEIYIFYGRVKLKVSKFLGKKLREDGTYPEYYRLNIYTLTKRGEWKYKLNIFRGIHQDEIDEEKVYNIAILGQLDFSYKFMQIKIDYEDSVSYRLEETN